jgi:hypothetical protein
MRNHCVLRLATRAALAAALTVALAPRVSAHSNGQILASGKQGGFYCRNCHLGGTVPTVAFDGPMAIDAGSAATFTFIVTSQAASQMAAGLNVAADAGALGLVANQGTRLQENEVTHTEAKANDGNGEAAFEFTWQAPETAGSYTLYGAGCSVDGNDAADGDAAARTTYQVVVRAAAPSATPTETPAPSTPTPTATRDSTPSGGACAGDCNDNGTVAVNELITGVNIALSTASVSVCSSFDVNGNGQVTIDELLRAVNNALSSCPVA